MLIYGQADYHLYYVPMIFQLYLIFPLIFYFLKKDNITKSKIQQITYKTITVNNAFNLDIELNKYTAAGWSICYIQSDLTNDYDYFTVVFKKEGD